MARVSLFKLPKYNYFNYQPRYYDPEKEARDERTAVILSEMGVKDENTEEVEPTYRATIKGKMRHYYSPRAKSNKQSNIRLLLIAGFLFFLSYFLIFY